MFYAKRNSKFYIFGKGLRARPKSNMRKPSLFQGPKKLGLSRPKYGNFRPVTSLIVRSFFWILRALMQTILSPLVHSNTSIRVGRTNKIKRQSN